MGAYVDDLVPGGHQKPARTHLDKAGRLELGRVGPRKCFQGSQHIMQTTDGITIVTLPRPEYTAPLTDRFKKQFNISGPLKAAATLIAAKDLNAQ